MGVFKHAVRSTCMLLLGNAVRDSYLILQSIEPVRLWQFVVATLFVLPKICLHVFIGSKMANLSDGGRRSQMDTRKKLS